MSIDTERQEEAAQFRRELWLWKALQHKGVDIFAGVTDPKIRAERSRAGIRSAGLTAVIAGRGKDGKPRTFAEAFEQIYNQPLELQP